MKKTLVIFTALWGLSNAFSSYAEEAKMKDKLTDQQRMNIAQDFANKQDWRSVFEIMQPLALEGNVQAQGNLGMLYNLGRGVEKNKEKAYWWFSEAAEMGNIRAINNLAMMYYSGDYVKKNIPQAIKLFETTAKAKDLDAMMMLAEIYLKQKDETKSFEWVKKATGLENPGAKLRLGIYYEEGIGTSMNKPLAALIYREILISNNIPNEIKQAAEQRLRNLY
ncbi:sel1 repeat family protein [Rodentibacter pneumotropicus]|uniref:Sel1 repeat family protein n=1 Tax=Rodentibacter pneumotropicus TaxID=758 RepID=A0A4S2P614_9PAST|nr:tetratricopeptide repeat protein [Rodentibacter pneumotropicus]TGZ98318.1 sel1 repeat family protein [Rodentibacter pneumotropicus]THA00863.1 sel1 repeat family protein [Rodentibacter pneumotropicus]THA09025.1 sel1 repeat family protein [Rodentibacter pneumotropicus]THA14841.1 sel1 repeat family protein [Rodentibacter pneumotropicus]